MKMSVMNIKQAEIDDIHYFLPLISDYWKFEGIQHFNAEKIEKQLTRLFSEPNLGLGWLAFLHSEAVGYLLAVYAFSLEHLGLTAEIDEFYILPQYRRYGIGRAMIQTAELGFLKAGCTNVSLQVEFRNDSAHTFYFGQGYIKRTRYEILEKNIK